jgi:hypothetical protein
MSLVQQQEQQVLCETDVLQVTESMDCGTAAAAAYIDSNSSYSASEAQELPRVPAAAYSGNGA